MVQDVAPDTVIEIESEDSIVTARQRARDLARSIGFGLVDQSRIATAVSELTRNVVRYATAGRGEVTITLLHDAPPRGQAERWGIEIVVADEGPGIADVDQAMRDGVSTSRGMGMGLPGTRRLMDEMNIESAPGRGTTVTIRKWRR